MHSPAEVVDASLLFLARHEEALEPTNPRRALEACEGLHKGLCETLAPEVGLALDRVATPPDLARATAGDASALEAVRLVAVRRRIQETEGVLMHLRLTLQKGTADGPALATWQRRVWSETDAAHRCIAQLRATLRDWAREPRAPADAREALRLARSCLAAGRVEPAAALIRGAMPARSPDVDAALASREPALVWAALDAAQRALDAIPAR